VFSQADARLRLQALLHPLISAEIQYREKEIRHKNVSLVVIDIPLLIESSYWRQHADRVLVVDCDESTQVRRVVQRSHLKPEQVVDIMAQQAGRSQRLAGADWVVNNNVDDMLALQKAAKAIQLHF
jgi:dephospho-CoA kinase